MICDDGDDDYDSLHDGDDDSVAIDDGEDDDWNDGGDDIVVAAMIVITLIMMKVAMTVRGLLTYDGGNDLH